VQAVIVKVSQSMMMMMIGKMLIMVMMIAMVEIVVMLVQAKQPVVMVVAACRANKLHQT